MTRRELVLSNLRSTAIWLVVTVPVFGATAVASLLTLGWGAFVVMPFVLGPVYLMLVAGLSQKTLPDAGWLWFLVLCFAGGISACLGLFLYEPLESALGPENAIWLWGGVVAAGAWAGPTLLNMAYLLSFSDEECAILTRNAPPTETTAGPSVAQF